MKAEYFGTTWVGKECKKIIKESNLKILERIAPHDLQIFVTCMKDIGAVYSACCGTQLNADYSCIIENLKNL